MASSDINTWPQQKYTHKPSYALLVRSHTVRAHAQSASLSSVTGAAGCFTAVISSSTLSTRI